MKSCKKLLSLIMAIVIIATALPISAFGAGYAPSRPAMPTFISTTNSINVKWTKVKNASGYVLYKYNSSTKKYTKILQTTSLNSTVKSLNSGTTYRYSVKAYRVVKSKKYYSSYSPILVATTLPSKPVGLKAVPAVNSITLSWSRVIGATSYTVYRYNSSTNAYTKLGTTKNLSYKINSLKEGTKYSYAVMATKALNNKSYNSAKSSVVYSTTKVASLSAPTGVKASDITTVSAKISFNTVSGAQGYTVQRSTSSGFSSYASVSSATKPVTISNLKHNTTYYVRVYAYKTVNGKKYTSPASAVIKFKTVQKYLSTKSTVNEATTYQTIEGFGASGCWWAQRIGRWSDEDALIERDAENEALWTQEQTRNALKYMYDAEEGIGLNIYRYNLGTDSYKDDTIYNKWSRTEGFLDSIDEDGNLVYDWNKDKASMNTLSVVKDLAGDDLRLTLFANSPPTQLTENGLACCDDKGVDYWEGNGGDIQNTRYYLYHQNLPNDNKSYITYAKYLCDVADHFVNEGYYVSDVSPVNEPQTDWTWKIDKTSGKKVIGQEGCHYTPAGMAKLAAYCAIAGENKPYKFSMFDSGAADGANVNDLNCSSIKYLDSLFTSGSYLKDLNGKTITSANGKKYIKDINKDYYTNISTHSYWCNKQSKQEFADYVAKNFPTVKSFTCTEYCQMTNDSNTGVFDISSPIEWWDPERNGLTIEYGVQLARVMHDDLTTLNATEWDWWTGCSGGYYPDGLVYVDYQNPDNVQTSKRLWAMGNYSKFIKRGAVRVDIEEAQSELLSTAYKNPDGSLVIVYVNPSKDTVLEYNKDENGKDTTPKKVLREEIDRTVHISASGYTDCSVFVTNDEFDLENTENCKYSYDKAINIPGQSVVTVVLK